MAWKDLGQEILEEFADAIHDCGRGRDRAFSLEAYLTSGFAFPRRSMGTSSKLLRIGDRHDTLAGWARLAGISPPLVRYRMQTWGCTLEAALSTPKYASSLAARARAAGLDERTVRKRITCGMSVEAALAKRVAPRPAVTIAERARAAGVDPGLVQKRVRNGWTIEQALSLPKCAPQECRMAPRRRAESNHSEIPNSSNHPEIQESPKPASSRRSAA